MEGGVESQEWDEITKVDGVERKWFGPRGHLTMSGGEG